jgi:alkylation response protein AidB-like acyl-CoA dehydrogenase
MDFAPDGDQQLIVDTVRRFAERELRGCAADADRAAAPPERVVAAIRELGLATDAVPSDAGGDLDGGYRHATRALRGVELGRGCAALAALVECNVEAALATARWGSATAKVALFTALTKGELACLAHDSRGTLEITDAGGKLSVHGKLGPTPVLAAASWVLVASGPHLFLANAAQLQRTPIAPSGWRAARWATAELDATIAADHVLANDVDAVADVLAWARTSLAARAAGVAAAAMEHAASYARERVQFGQPIGRFEAIVRLRDDAETGIAAARLMALHAGWMLDSHPGPAARDAASRARVLAGDVVARATVDAVQIFGGYGFVNDFPVEKLMRDSRAFEGWLGDERLGRVLARKQELA